MRLRLIGTTVLALVAVGGYTVLAANRSGSCAVNGAAAGSASCEAAPGEQARSAWSGKVLGKFDPAMSGCRFACATKLEYDAKDLVPQPGAKNAQLTRCPVSGVVFAVDDRRPRVRVGAEEYVTCCGTCAGKLRGQPGRFVKVGRSPA